MRVLHLNTRATQGGAAQVASVIHRLCVEEGIDSTYLYGYATGIREDPDADDSYAMIGDRPTVLLNYASHLVFGREFLTANSKRLDEHIDHSDIVQIHNLHHYYLDLGDLYTILRRHNKPSCFTLHDEWLLTGRCSSTRGCTSWRRGCGECKSKPQPELPSLYDFSRRNRERKHKIIKSHERTAFVSPSRWLQTKMSDAGFETIYIPNAINGDFFEVEGRPRLSKHHRLRIAVCVNDFSQENKVCWDTVTKIKSDERVEFVLIGKNPPEHIGETHGYVKEKRRLAELYASCDCFLYSSTVDNAPLVLIEALATGLKVFALSTDPSKEILAPLRVPTYDRVDLVGAVLEYVQSHAAISSCSDRKSVRDMYSEHVMFARYKGVWESLIA